MSTVCAPDSLAPPYRLVYDAGAHYTFEWLLIPFGMLTVGLCISIYLFHENGRSRSERFRRGFVVAWTMAVGLLGIGFFLDSYGEFAYYRDSLRSGHATVVEGVVSHFDPEPPRGHHHESFDVADQHFTYSQYVINSGFNRSRGAGGPIRDGLHVRIAALDGRILRLEIADR